MSWNYTTKFLYTAAGTEYFTPLPSTTYPNDLARHVNRIAWEVTDGNNFRIWCPSTTLANNTNMDLVTSIPNSNYTPVKTPEGSTLNVALADLPYIGLTFDNK